MTATETHLAGLDVTWDGRWLRQRCAWCGAVLLDYDLERVAVAVPDGEEPEPPSTWPLGALVCTDGAATYTVDPDESESGDGSRVPPDDACLRLDPEVTA